MIVDESKGFLNLRGDFDKVFLKLLPMSLRTPLMDELQ